MRNTTIALCAAAFLFFAAGCGEEGKISEVKKTVLPDCGGKTTEDLVLGLLQNPVWGYEEAPGGRKFVTVNGTIIGDKIPTWIRGQKFLETTMRFSLDPKTGKFDPEELSGFPALGKPEGLLQAYRLLMCTGTDQNTMPDRGQEPGRKADPSLTTTGVRSTMR